MEFPVSPSGTGLQGSSGSSDLMKRVGVFLPQIRASNEELLQRADKNSSDVCIDASMVKDVEAEDDGQQRDSDSDDSKQDEIQAGTPTIELKVALGPIKENPAISLLANNSDSDREDETSSFMNHCANKKHGEGKTRQAFSDEKESKITVATQGDRGRSEEAPKKKRKVLIEEIS